MNGTSGPGDLSEEHPPLDRDEGPVLHVDLDLEPAQALRRVAQTADIWGAGWKAEGVSGGRLVIPVMAGLRRGWVGGVVSVDRRGNGARVSFRPEESSYRVDRAAFVTLLIAAVGALLTLLAPFIPRLWPLVPMGIILGLAAWLFIVARLRNSGPEELLADLEIVGDEPAEE